MRRSITLLALVCLPLLSQAQSVYPGQFEGRLAVANRAHFVARAFDLCDVRLLPGRVRDNLERDSAWMAKISVNRLLHSFRTTAGLFSGREGGYMTVKKLGGWESLDCDLRGHTTGHLLSALALMYAATGAELFKAKGDSLVAGLAEVQASYPDGYLAAFPQQLIERNLKGQSVWAPWYTLHKILAGLIDQCLYAENAQALEVAKKMGAWAYNKLKDLSAETRRKILRNEFGGFNEAAYNLYALTGDTRYQALAELFYHEDVLAPVKRHDHDAFGTKHTNTFIPKVLAEARLHELDGAQDSVSLYFWSKMVTEHIFAPGCLSQKEHFFNTERFSDFLNGYTGETCCTYNMLKLTSHLFCLDANPDRAEYYERALFNHILGQQDLESGMVCYFLPMLTGAYKVYSTAEKSFWCCVGSGFESHAKYAEAIYYHSDDSLYVNQFIPSRLEWKQRGVTLTQQTAFPYNETTRLTVESHRPERFTLILRYPRWSGTPQVRVNGKKVAITQMSGTYIALRREWKKGDVVEATYPMSLHWEAAPDNAGRAAVLYGPIVLAGQLGEEGITAPAPFSDPGKYNDYYTYNYNVPDHLNTTLRTLTGLKRAGRDLLFTDSEGHALRPLFDTHHQRYVVYWNRPQTQEP